MPHFKNQFHHMVYLVFALLIVMACQFMPTFNKPTPTPLPIASDCANSSTQMTDQDVKSTLDFTGDTFKSDDWNRTYKVEEGRVDVTYHSKEGYSVVFLERLLYPCGLTHAGLLDTFNEAKFKEVIYSQYQDLKPTNLCTSTDGQTTLREFTGTFDSQIYTLRHWVKINDTTHITTLSMTFLPAVAMEMDNNAKAVFPGLSSCP